MDYVSNEADGQSCSEYSVQTTVAKLEEMCDVMCAVFLTAVSVDITVYMRAVMFSLIVFVANF